MNAYTDTNLVSEFESHFRDATIKPTIIGCTWQHFQDAVIGGRIGGQPYEAHQVMYFGKMTGGYGTGIHA